MEIIHLKYRIRFFIMALKGGGKRRTMLKKSYERKKKWAKRKCRICKTPTIIVNKEQVLDEVKRKRKEKKGF